MEAKASIIWLQDLFLDARHLDGLAQLDDGVVHQFAVVLAHPEVGVAHQPLQHDGVGRHRRREMHQGLLVPQQADHLGVALGDMQVFFESLHPMLDDAHQLEKVHGRRQQQLGHQMGPPLEFDVLGHAHQAVHEFRRPTGHRDGPGILHEDREGGGPEGHAVVGFGDAGHPQHHQRPAVGPVGNARQLIFVEGVGQQLLGEANAHHPLQLGLRRHFQMQPSSRRQRAVTDGDKFGQGGVKDRQHGADASAAETTAKHPNSQKKRAPRGARLVRGCVSA
jgi:hypothetical protein